LNQPVTGREPGSRCSPAHQEAGPRLKAGVTESMGFHPVLLHRSERQARRSELTRAAPADQGADASLAGGGAVGAVTSGGDRRWSTDDYGRRQSMMTLS